MIAKGDCFLMALSGGEGSMSALKMLRDITSPIPDITIRAVTVDAGLKGLKTDKAAKYCKKIGVEHETVSFKDAVGLDLAGILKEACVGESMACGVCSALKWRLIEDCAKRSGATRIATGRTLDDEIQSAFMSIVGGNIRGLVGSGAPRGCVPRIDILRECPGEEVKLYAKLGRLHCSGRSCRYFGVSRRAAAQRLLDSMEENHPGSKYQMLRSMDGFGAILAARTGGGAAKRCGLCGQECVDGVCGSCAVLDGLGHMWKRGLFK
jgi:uncharacterized protein (TIGR00269 family)